MTKNLSCTEMRSNYMFYSNEQHGQMDLRALAEDGRRVVNERPHSN